MAAPIPLEDPVTNATFAVQVFMVLNSGSGRRKGGGSLFYLTLIHKTLITPLFKMDKMTFIMHKVAF
jgi:hypothetical protein